MKILDSNIHKEVLIFMKNCHQVNYLHTRIKFWKRTRGTKHVFLIIKISKYYNYYKKSKIYVDQSKENAFFWLNNKVKCKPVVKTNQQGLGNILFLMGSKLTLKINE